MLIQFKVANFRSFGSEVTLSLEAVKAFKENEENVVEVGGYRLLRSAAIYGANASGKTNFGKAVFFMRDFILTSAGKNSVAEIAVEPFRLNAEYLGKPSLFEATFLLDGITYRYGFEVARKEVCAEWLFRSSGPRNKEFRLFTRDHDGIDVSDDYAEGNGREADTRNNALFLSTVDQRNGAIAHQIVKWFDEFFVLLRTPDELLERLMATMLDNQEVHERVLNFIQQIDESIDDVFGGESQSSADYLRDLSPEMAKVLNRPVTVRRKRSDGATVDFDLDREESAGTKKILWLAAYLLGILEYGSVAFADELEARLHPHLTRRLVRLFNSPKTNPKNAQLVFVTHDTNLLTYGGLRRDQVWFCEKNRKGSTDLYSLAEIKVRKGARFENDYIGGRYGAIPYFGNVAEVGGETK